MRPNCWLEILITSSLSVEAFSMFMQDLVEGLRCCFSPPQCSSEVFVYMLRALSLTPQHNSDQGKLVRVYERVYVLLSLQKFPFFVYQEILQVAGRFTAYGLGWYPLVPQAPRILYPLAASVQAYKCPLNLWEGNREANRTLNSTLAGEELRNQGNLFAGLSAFRFYSAVCLPGEEQAVEILCFRRPGPGALYPRGRFWRLSTAQTKAQCTVSTITLM